MATELHSGALRAGPGKRLRQRGPTQGRPCTGTHTGLRLVHAVRGDVAMQMKLAEAKAKLSQLLAAVDAGEEVIIARDGVPAARIVPMGLQASWPS